MMGCFVIRLKLFFRDKTAIICLCACALITVAVMMQLNLHAAERSALPVGLEVKGNGPLSQKAADSFRQNEAVYIYEGSFDFLYELLTDGYIYCIVSFNEDFDRNIAQGATDGIMTLYSAKDNKIATIVGDIAAGCCMDAVCMYKAYNTYAGLGSKGSDTLSGLGQLFGIGSGADADDRKHTIGNINEYAAYLKEMEDSGEFEYSFEFEYVNTGGKENRDITNGLIYRQVICGLMGMLLMLCAFCTCSMITKEYENGIRERIKTSAQPAVITGITEIFALFMCTAPLAAVIMILGKNLSMLLLNLALILLSTTVFYLIANILRNVFAYQLAGAIVTIVAGVCGFVSIFEGVAGGKLFGYTPMGIYIRIMSEML